jgi:large subunit ribosomal protein LP0
MQTLMRCAINELIEKDKSKKHLQIIHDALKLNTGLIFTDGDLTEVKKILDTQVREAPAKIGSLAPSDVSVPAGPTGLDPKQTQFFQALNIQTKIVKSQVEIVNPVKVITAGEKVTPGQASLLEKLKIRPFEYKMHVLSILDNGQVYPASVLAITTDSILEGFKNGAQNVSAVSLAIGMPNAASVHHCIINAFKNLACASFGSGFSFKEADRLKASASAAPAQAAAPAGGAPAKAAPAKKEEPEEEIDMDMGDMFGY